MATRRRALLGIWLIALLLRAVYLWEISHAPFFELRLGDAQAYHAWARQIADGAWLGGEVFYQAPLYPYFLALIYSLLDDSTMIVRIVQALVGASSCALLASAGISLFGLTGAAAGLLLAFYPTAIYFDGLLEKTSLVVFFTTALLAVLAARDDRVRLRRAFAAGFVLGLFALARENALALVPVVLLWSAGGSALVSRRGRAASVAACIAGLVLTLFPVALRNRAVSGEFHLTTSQFGPNLYIGNHAGATGTYDALVPGHGSAADERQDATRLAERATGRRLGPAEVSGFWTSRVLHYIRTQPADWLRLTTRKVALTLNAVELADTESSEVYAEWSRLLRVLRPYGFTAVLAMAAAAAVLTARSWPTLWLFYALAGVYVASVTMFYVLERYRVPLVPVLMLVAAGGVRELAWPLQRVPRIGIAAAAAVVAVAIAQLPLADEQHARAAHYTGIADVLAADSGRLDDAAAFYRRALAEAPNAPAAQFGLGTALVKMGRTDEAIPLLRAAVTSRPDYTEARHNLGVALEATGRVHEAADEYRAAVRLRPDDLDTHLALAKALTQTGRTEEAIAAYRAALILDPNRGDIHNDLGATLAGAGRIAQALPHFERAVALNPSDENARRNRDRARQLLQSGR